MKCLPKINKFCCLLVLLSAIIYNCNSTVQDLSNHLSIEYKYIDFVIVPNEPMWWKRELIVSAKRKSRKPQQHLEVRRDHVSLRTITSDGHLGCYLSVVATHHSTFSRWYGEFKRRRITVSDNLRAIAPKMAVTQENLDAIHQRKLTCDNIKDLNSKDFA
ncbi:hypothetical protein Trydic_g6832 [Trypoxylus dichotomus]